MGKTNKTDALDAKGLAPGKGHGRAVVAVARHLAEASFWVLRKRQPCKDPAPRPAGNDAA